MTRTAAPSPNDAAYLRGDQYRDARNLNARLALHRLFSTNQQGWMPWLFEHLLEVAPTGGGQVLELGCGAGTLWRANQERLPAAWLLTLTDFSAGMLSEAAGAIGKRARYAIAEAQRLPFVSSAFDIVVANHMLYHVGEREQALREIHRVLRPGGILFASTVGDRHMIELDDHLAALGFTGDLQGRAMSRDFTLENGGAQLARVFADVSLHRYEDELLVTDVEPLMDYVRSMRAGSVLSDADLESVQQRFTAELARQGCIRIYKDSGVFIAKKVADVAD